MNFNRPKFIFTSLMILAMAACAKSGFRSSQNGVERIPESSGIINGVVKVVALIPVVMDGSGSLHMNASISNPVTIVNPTNVKFSLDGSAITTPPITNTLLDFGKLKIGELFDNNIKVCGTDGKKKCSKAYIQMYTTGTPGSGIWNTDGGYGMPIYANLTGSTRLTVGLTAAKAAVVQTQAIDSTKNVLRITDFSVPLAYEMKADFTQAGAGSYSTTLVVEYGLLE